MSEKKITKQIYDLIILGSGPTGLYGAFYANMNNLKTLIIEIDNNIGGAPSKLYPNKQIYDFPSIKKITGQKLINNLFQQLNTVNNWTISLNTNIIQIDKMDDVFELISDNEQKFYGKYIVICIGYGAFKFKEIENNLIDDEIKEKIDYKVSDEKKYLNKNVLIFGGGDSAVDYANLLSKKGKNLSLIHHSDKLRALQNNVEKMKKNKIDLYLNSKILEIKNDYVLIEYESQSQKLFYDYLLVFYGVETLKSNITNMDIFDDKNKIMVDEKYESIKIKKLFACGSINNKNVSNLIINGISQIVEVITNIKKKIK